jgi:hypothetical protein
MATKRQHPKTDNATIQSTDLYKVIMVDVVVFPGAEYRALVVLKKQMEP